MTGYTCGDLFKDRKLMEGAKACLFDLIEEVEDLDILCAVGMPIPSAGRCITARRCSAAAFCSACRQSSIFELLQFYRSCAIFSPRRKSGMLRYAGRLVRLLRRGVELAPDVTVGVEICEDVWVADPPGVTLAKAARPFY